MVDYYRGNLMFLSKFELMKRVPNYYIGEKEIANTLNQLYYENCQYKLKVRYLFLQLT